ncbi:MAG TPA: Asp-tRNA(Asn)/Glu-tRNA(Gln) amidotransferase subunit GatC [Candidatus Paceibacterota bacterium]
MLSKEEVQHIAKLARIELSDTEVEKFQKELGDVLEYFEILGELDTATVQPMTHSVALANIKRQDATEPNLDSAETLLEMAPETQNGYLKVKSIL